MENTILQAELPARQVHPADAVVRRAFPIVRGMSRRFCSCLSDAEEVAQRTLIRVFENWRAAEGKASLGGWLFYVTRDVASKYYRQERAHARRFAPMPPAEGERDEGKLFDPADQRASQDAESADTVAAVREALASCSAEDCDLLTRHVVEGQSAPAMAKEAGRAAGCIASRVNKAKARVRAALVAAGLEGCATMPAPLVGGWASAQEAGERYGVKVSTIRHWVCTRKVRRFKSGNANAVSLIDVERMSVEQKALPPVCTLPGAVPVHVAVKALGIERHQTLHLWIKRGWLQSQLVQGAGHGNRYVILDEVRTVAARLGITPSLN